MARSLEKMGLSQFRDSVTDTSLAFQTLHQFGHCSIWRLKDNQQLALGRLSFLCSLRPHPSQQKPSEQHCVRIISIIWRRRKESVCAFVIGISLNLYHYTPWFFPAFGWEKYFFEGWNFQLRDSSKTVGLTPSSDTCRVSWSLGFALLIE